MMWSGASRNHADDDINKSESEKKNEKRDGGLSLLEGDARNITIYKLIPDLWGDPFVIGYHVP